MEDIDITTEYELTRTKKLEALRSAIEHDRPQTEINKAILDSTESLTDGVNSAHARIRLRKKEMNEMNEHMRTIAESMLGLKEDLNKTMKRFIFIVCFIGVGTLLLLGYLIHQDQSAITAAGTLTNAVKILSGLLTV